MDLFSLIQGQSLSQPWNIPTSWSGEGVTELRRTLEWGQTWTGKKLCTWQCPQLWPPPYRAVPHHSRGDGCPWAEVHVSRELMSKPFKFTWPSDAGRSPSNRPKRAAGSKQLKRCLGTALLPQGQLYLQQKCYCPSGFHHMQRSLRRLWGLVCQDHAPTQGSQSWQALHQPQEWLYRQHLGLWAHQKACNWCAPTQCSCPGKCQKSKAMAKLKHFPLPWAGRCQPTETHYKGQGLTWLFQINQGEKMSKWQLRLKCLKKRDKLFEQNHRFHFSIVTCLLIGTDVSLVCAKQKRTWGLKYWLIHKYYHQFSASDSKSTASLCQTKPPDDFGSSFAVPKAQMTSFSPPYTCKHCVIPPRTSSAHQSQACATCIVAVF